MIDATTATTEIRRLSRLKGYPRSWDSASATVSEQDTQAEAALIDAAASAPSVSRLRQFIADWERSHIEAPAPAVLYEAWRAGNRYTGTRRTTRCQRCGDTGWWSRYYVADAINGHARRDERIYLEGSAEEIDAIVDDWWRRIRETPTCAQRVYAESVKCGCGGGSMPVPADPQGDADMYRQFARSGERYDG